MAITQALVIFDWSDLGGGIPSGTDTLELSDEISDGLTELRPPAITPTAKLDSVGMSALIVPANDDDTTVPLGTYYRHIGRIGNAVVRELKTITSFGLATVISGSGAPSGGADGDWYVQTTTGTAYGPRASGTWPVSGITIGNWDGDVPEGQIYWAACPLIDPVFIGIGGGGQTSDTFSIESIMRTLHLNELRPPTGATDWNGQLISGLGTGVFSDSAATVAQATGWELDQNPWTFVSASQFTIPGIAAVFAYVKGVKVKWSESGTVKYGVVLNSTTSSGHTVVNLIPTTDYSMTVNPDGGTTYASFGRPSDFPVSFTFTPVWTGFSSNPATAYAEWSVNGGYCDITWGQFGDGTSNATTLSFTVPIGAAASVTCVVPAKDNGSQCLAVGTLAAGTSLVFDKNVRAGAWTNSGTKTIELFNIRYLI